MAEQVFTIKSKTGLHSRPATKLVNKAGQYESEITLEYKGRKVNLKSIMGVMSLGVPRGAQITIRADGSDGESALHGIAEVIKEELGE